MRGKQGQISHQDTSLLFVFCFFLNKWIIPPTQYYVFFLSHIGKKENVQLYFVSFGTILHQLSETAKCVLCIFFFWWHIMHLLISLGHDEAKTFILFYVSYVKILLSFKNTFVH